MPTESGRTNGRATEWWREATVYQIYPRSFQDASGDGVGDLPGIERRLDHLVDLGIDAVWISPFYPSPMKDFGYDVSDYTGVDPLFGTMDDFDRLLGAVHARGLKLILDFVPNHSSSEHPWFTESASSRDSAKRDWYIWRDPAPDGGAPNNWRSSSGGSAWEWHAGTEQYYLHKFLPSQPDLNWRNRAVREAMLDAMRFWLERGVDGFRLDVVYHCIKDAAFRDDPANPDYDPDTDPPFGAVRPVHSTNQHPEIMELVVNPMRKLADEFGALLIGEIYLDHPELVRYYGDRPETGVQLPFNFSLVFADFTAEALATLVRDYEALIPEWGWPNWVLGNHDQSRVATRLGAERARLAAMLLLTLRGTPTIYYGDEIGMLDVDIPPDRVRDPWEINMPDLGEGRDPCRTPMRWTGEANRGFCPPDVEPWLPIGPMESNVAEQGERENSALAHHRRLLALRREHPALSRGRYEHVGHEGDVLIVERVDGARADGAQAAGRVVVAMNFGKREAAVPERARAKGLRTLHSTHDDPIDATDPLRPLEGRIMVIRS